MGLGEHGVGVGSLCVGEQYVPQQHVHLDFCLRTHSSSSLVDFRALVLGLAATQVLRKLSILPAPAAASTTDALPACESASVSIEGDVVARMISSALASFAFSSTT